MAVRNTFPLVFDFYFRDLGVGVFFNSIELHNTRPSDYNWNPVTNVDRLLSDEQVVQAGTKKALSISFKCATDVHHDISMLKAKIGAVATLKIDDDSYTNCHISGFEEKDWGRVRHLGRYEYTVSFVRDTT